MGYEDENIMNDVEVHLMNGDLILQAALTIADLAGQHALDAGEIESNHRIQSIAEFIRLYRARTAALIGALSRNEKAA